MPSSTAVRGRVSVPAHTPSRVTEMLRKSLGEVEEEEEEEEE